MNVLALWGKGSHGKTQTLNLLAIEFGEICNDIKKDTHYAFTYKNKTIFITTKGDDWGNIEKEFKELPDAVDLYICASRTKGSSVKFIENFATNGNVFWLAKTSLSFEENGKYNINSQLLKQLQNDLNKAQAKQMKQIIDQFIASGLI